MARLSGGKLIIEMIVCFWCLPPLMLFLPHSYRFLMLGGLFIFAALVLHFEGMLKFSMGWKLEWNGELRLMLWRFAAIAALLALVVCFYRPETFLGFPRRAPLRWLLVCCLYPLLSAWPQELIYRRFFFHRYGKALGGRGCFLINIMVFSFLHLIYLNLPALLLSLAGGMIFTSTYRRNGSLTLVTIEHSLYGLLIFSIGLGGYFFQRA